MRQAFMRDRRDVGLFLNWMAELPKAPHKARPKSNAFLSCTKVFRMQGQFKAEFPCWTWSFLSRERSEGLSDPFPSAGTRPRELWIGDAQTPGPGIKTYRFKWKDVSGLAARETASEVVIYPELKGTDFQVRGFYLEKSADLPCGKPPDGYWSIRLSAVRWATDASCRSWLSRWKPPLPGRKTGSTYEMSLQHCGRFVRMLPQRVRVLCAKGPRGLTTFTLDATAEIFDDALPVLERVRDSFRLVDETPGGPPGGP
jgi:hypothetical protein